MMFGKKKNGKIHLADFLDCLRCGHNWRPRKEVVICCPRCGSPYWNKPRRNRPAYGKPSIERSAVTK